MTPLGNERLDYKSLDGTKYVTAALKSHLIDLVLRRRMEVSDAVVELSANSSNADSIEVNDATG